MGGSFHRSWLGRSSYTFHNDCTILPTLPFEETDLNLPADIPPYTIGARSRRLFTVPVELPLPIENWVKLLRSRIIMVPAGHQQKVVTRAYYLALLTRLVFDTWRWRWSSMTIPPRKVEPCSTLESNFLSQSRQSGTTYFQPHSSQTGKLYGKMLGQGKTRRLCGASTTVL